MSKKLFVIAAFSVALLASSELVAAEWEHGVLEFITTKPKDGERISVEFKKYDYVVMNMPEVQKKMNEAGARMGIFVLELGPTLRVISRQGWELVAAHSQGYRTVMYFKKPK